MKKFLLMAALVLPMMVMMTGCNKAEKYFIKTWVDIEDPTVSFVVEKDYSCRYEELYKNGDKFYMFGSWYLSDDNTLSATLEEILSEDGQKESFTATFKKIPSGLYWVEQDVTFK